MERLKKEGFDSFDSLLKHLFSKALKKQNQAHKRFEKLRREVEKRRQSLKLPKNFSL
jgi:hypothetical protein